MAGSAEHLRTAERIALRARHATGAEPSDLIRGWSRLTQAALGTHEALTLADPSRIVGCIAAATRALESAGSQREWHGSVRAGPPLAPTAAAVRTAGAGAALTGLDEIYTYGEFYADDSLQYMIDHGGEAYVMSSPRGLVH